MKTLTHSERNQLGKEAIELMIKLLPPEEFGENDKCEELYNIITDLSELSDEQIGARQDFRQV